jgi:transposase
MSHHVKGKNRSQATFFPEVLDDFVSTENPIRVIDVFVDELDLIELGFKGVLPKDTGRPNYHPEMLLKLYLYGYLNRIQSSRQLEREANRNIELMWLTERLAPDFKTIADFRKNNGEGIKQSCRTFIGLCRQLNMFSDAVVAIDGSTALEIERKVKSQYLFCTRKGEAHSKSGFDSKWRRFKQLINLDDIHFHDIRAKTGTDAKLMGKNHQALLGHSDISQSEKYVKSRMIEEIEPLDFNEKQAFKKR